MARGQAAAATAVSGGRRVLLLLRPRGADGALPPAAAAASCDRRCLGDWQRPAAPPGPGAAVTAVNGGAGWGRRVGGTGRESRRRCGERGESGEAEEEEGGGAAGEGGAGCHLTRPGHLTRHLTRPRGFNGGGVPGACKRCGAVRSSFGNCL